MSKILVACPTYDGQKYCAEQFLESIKSINHEVVFFDNSEDNDYFEFLKNKGCIVIRVDCGRKRGDERIAECMNFIRAYFLERNFDFLFSLETDVIAPEKIIDALTSKNKDIIAGIYLTEYNVTHIKNNGTKYSEWEIHPVADVYSPKMNYLRPLPMEVAKKNLVVRVASIGLGCTLIKKEVLEKTRFRYEKDFTHDVLFCIDAQMQGFQVFADTSQKCIHIKKDKELRF